LRRRRARGGPPSRGAADSPAVVSRARRHLRDQRDGHGERARRGSRHSVGALGRGCDERQVLPEPRPGVGRPGGGAAGRRGPVLAPLSGYLLLAERLWDSVEFATAFNLGPPESDARTVGWVVGRLGELWPDGIERHTPEGDTGPPEARTLKLDSSRARERLGWNPP